MDALGLISGGSPPGTGLMTRSAERDATGAFSSSLSAAMAGETSRTNGRDPREAAEELVAMTLVQPILAQLRDSSMAADPFKPTEAEQKFGALYDAEVARRIVSSSGFPLVDALARQMRERTERQEVASDAQRDARQPEPITLDLSA